MVKMAVQFCTLHRVRVGREEGEESSIKVGVREDITLLIKGNKGLS